jgi:phosphatidate cytidylyltransferase
VYVSLRPNNCVVSNLITRSIAGIIFSACVLSSAWLGPVVLGLLFLFFCAFGLHEIYALLKNQKTNAPRWLTGMVIGIAIYMMIFLIMSDVLPASMMWIFAAIIPVIFCIELIRLDHSALSNLSVTIFGWVYVVLPFAMINVLPWIHGMFEFELVVGYFLILWANDTGAYFTGKWLGKHKLYYKVSPNKTWEGLFGGILLSFGAALLLHKYFGVLMMHDWLVMAFIVAVFGNLGDLFESHLNIIPGHGGVLDRFDGLLISLPILIAYFKIISI